MSSGGVTIRRARDEDVENILDLLAYYEVPRSYFEPFYLRDPSYRPEHSQVAKGGDSSRISASSTGLSR
jgi:hypothetical protein